MLETHYKGGLYRTIIQGLLGCISSFDHSSCDYVLRRLGRDRPEEPRVPSRKAPPPEVAHAVDARPNWRVRKFLWCRAVWEVVMGCRIQVFWRPY